MLLIHLKNKIKKVIQTGLLFFCTDIKEYKQLKTQNHLNSNIMKTSEINFSSEIITATNEPIKNKLFKIKSMKNLLFTVLMLATSIIANAQSIQDQATRAGNAAFTDAMIRNVFIIIGIVLFFALSGSKKSKDDSKI